MVERENVAPERQAVRILDTDFRRCRPTPMLLGGDSDLGPRGALAIADEMVIMWSDRAGNGMLLSEGEEARAVWEDVACAYPRARLAVIFESLQPQLRPAASEFGARTLCADGGGVAVLQASGRSETLRMVERLASSAQSGHTDDKTYLQSCVLAKPSGGIPYPEGDARAPWLLMLLQVPGVSMDIASAVVERYPSWFALMRAYRALEGNPPAAAAHKAQASLLADIPRAARDVGKQMRIGPAASARIHSVFTTRDPQLALS